MMGRYIMALTCASMALSLLQVFLPKNGAGRVGRFAGGVLLILVMVWPLRSFDWAEIGDIPEFSLESGEEELEKIHHSQLELLIEQECEAYIEDKAASMGLSCSAEVSCRWETGESPQLDGVVITCADPEQARRVLEQYMEAELGIAVEKQTYREQVND